MMRKVILLAVKKVTRKIETQISLPAFAFKLLLLYGLQPSFAHLYLVGSGIAHLCDLVASLLLPHNRHLNRLVFALANQVYLDRLSDPFREPLKDRLEAPAHFDLVN